MSKNLFITGTGTDVGKTYIAGLILKKLRESGVSAAYYKAAMSGNGRREDGSLLPGDGKGELLPQAGKFPVDHQKGRRDSLLPGGIEAKSDETAAGHGAEGGLAA